MAYLKPRALERRAERQRQRCRTGGFGGKPDVPIETQHKSIRKTVQEGRTKTFSVAIFTGSKFGNSFKLHCFEPVRSLSLEATQLSARLRCVRGS